MIRVIAKSEFKKMPWKNGNGITTQICIEPTTASLEQNNFTYRLSSASVEKDGDFSLFPGKNRILVPIQGAGFYLNDDEYEKFEVAQFSGDEKIHCSLFKGPVLDFGIIYNPKKIKAQARILNLKSDLSFSLEPENEYFITVLDGAISFNASTLGQLETLHYTKERSCNLQVKKSAILLYLSTTPT
ncbi:HutD family protein [bacterium]|nr:HutD family protein [bacterium]